jgi:hypothetical protein
MSKFKIGDKVTPIFGCYAYKIGEIYEVKNVDIDYPGQVKTVIDSSGSRDNGWHEFNFELVERNTMNTTRKQYELKVGDEVEFLENYNSYFSTGKKAKVTELKNYFSDGEYLVCFRNNENKFS